MHFSVRMLFPAMIAIGLPALSFAKSPPPQVAEPLTPPTRAIQVGTLTLTPCAKSPAYCGFLPRPLDPAGEVPGSIDIHFEYYPPSDPSKPQLSTIVAAEGGPGYPSIRSSEYYRQLFLPLLDQHALVVVDNRGLGASAPIDCPGLQAVYPLTQHAIIACGAQLGARSDLYGTGLATDDEAAILDALATGPVDLYGDSYGSFYSQTFAGRHPDKLRSLTLDGTFQVVELSPWYPANAQTMRTAFNTVCARSLVCRGQSGTTLDRVQALLTILRSTPISGTAADGYGNAVPVTLDASGLGTLMFGAAFGPLIYRELDPAINAYLNSGDSAPLLRILAENNTSIPAYSFDNGPREISEGLYVAVSCTDYPQIYDMTAPPPVRALQARAAFAAQEAINPGIYAPFTIDEFNGLPLDYSLLDQCLNWPVPSLAHPPQQPVPPGTKFPDVPTLVLNGELDDLTSPISGRVAASLFPNSAQVIVANSFHVTALADPDQCASAIVRAFVATLNNHGDTSCAHTIEEVHTLPNFAQTVADVPPATALAGNQATGDDLKLAAAGALAAGDVLNRWWSYYAAEGPGLRGGTFSYTDVAPGIYDFTLSAYRWTNDLPVTGGVRWNYESGLVAARLTLGDPSAPQGTITVSWTQHQQQAFAVISGTINGRAVKAQMYAPS